MRVVVLASGSEGSACLVAAGGARLLIDAGIAARTLERKLAALGIPRLDGVLVTHAHADHIGHAARIAARQRVPIFATEATRRASGLDPDTVSSISSREPFELRGLLISPCPIPHDQAQIAVKVQRGGRSVAVVTDLGEPTGVLVDHLAGVELLLIEANHDPDMLANGPYPPSLKRRVGSARGHLSNAQCAEIVRRTTASTVVLMHLSRANNRADLARAVVADAIPKRRNTKLLVAPARGVVPLQTKLHQTSFAF